MLAPRVAGTAIVAFALGVVAAVVVPHMSSQNGRAETAPPKSSPAQAQPASTDEVRFEPRAPQLAQIKSTPAQVSDIPLSEALPARLAYDESATTRVASPVSGRIVALLARAGDRVKAGQPLARVDSPDFGVAVSDVEKARADLDRKAAALRRASAMHEAGLMARRDLEGAEADERQAAAEMRRAQSRLANLHGAHRAGGAFDLVSPIDGVVVDRQANPGMEARPDQQNPLFIVSDLRRLWLLVDVPEPALKSIAKGAEVSFEVAAYPGRTFTGRLDLVSPVFDPTTRRVQARAAIDNAEGLLRPEMFAKASVSTREGRKALRVPVSALITRGENTEVFVEQSPGLFVRRTVSLAAQNREYAYVARGIEAGDRVVTTGAMLLASEAGMGR